MGAPARSTPRRARGYHMAMHAPPAPFPRITLPVTGMEERFLVRRIYCVGRNYAAHAREMGGDPSREPPFFFGKDADAVAPDGATIPYPPGTRDYHHEVELVVAIGREGFDIAPDQAAALVYGYAVGLDMTRRDLQAAAKRDGKPWFTGKNFPLSAPVGPIAPAPATLMTQGAIRLTVNGQARQASDIAQMTWSVAETLSWLSQLYRLMPGDLVFTGTPEGVGAVQQGDTLHATIDGLPPLTVRIGPPAI